MSGRSRTSAHEAVVLRTVAFADNDVIAHLLTRDAGRVNAIVKGGRRSSSRRGPRLEPFLAVRVDLAHGRGDLATVREVVLVDGHDHIRSSWRLQDAASPVLMQVGRLVAGSGATDAVHNLVRHYLAELAAAGDDDRAVALLGAATLLKLLHALGVAPLLDGCVRCGDAIAVPVAFSASDGGVVCRACATGADRAIDAEVLDVTRRATALPLAALARASADERPALALIRTVERVVVTPMLDAHT